MHALCYCRNNFDCEDISHILHSDMDSRDKNMRKMERWNTQYEKNTWIKYKACFSSDSLDILCLFIERNWNWPLKQANYRNK